MPSAGSSIIVCGKRYDVNQKVVTFEDDANFSAYTPHRTDKPSEIYPFQPAKGMAQCVQRYRARRLVGADRSIDRLKQVLRQFVVHHDGCQDSKTCFQVLHNERGLSVHFLIDNDGTIYQTLDLVDCGFQAAGVNEISVGVELANRGDAQRFPNDYHGKRDKVTVTIHGHQFLSFVYTKEQVEAMINLGKSLARIFPNLPQTYPIGGDGDAMWTALNDPREYSGYLGHYHVTNQKWDPGPFDFKYFTSKIRSRMVFPVVLTGDKPDIPEEEDKVDDMATEFYRNNEEEGEGGGYFPVGPFGTSRLWHGGIHLHLDKGAPVYAPFNGKIVAARQAPDCPIGSRNFVLIKHQVAVGSATIMFWTLLFHLDDESSYQGTAAAWYQKAAGQLTDEPIPLNLDVAAGEIIGHVGEAGPPGRFEPILHLEIFSAEELGDRIDKDKSEWKLIEGAAMGRFCQSPEIVDKIDRPGPNGRKDGVLSRAELLNFYKSNPAREGFRNMATHHVSEWADLRDWQNQLAQTRDFYDMPKGQRATLFRDQIEPVLWWTDDIQDAADLPGDKMVWTYHPIKFIQWLHDRMLHSKSAAKSTIGTASDFSGKAPPSNIKDDAEATEGFTDDEDVVFGEGGRKLELEDLANGYPDDKK